MICTPSMSVSTEANAKSAGLSPGLGREQFASPTVALVLFNVRDRQLAGLQDYLAQFAEVPAPVVERNQSSPSGLRDRCIAFSR
jgi:hypothetical protein